MTTPDQHRTARLADLAAYVRLFEPWSRAGQREALSTYQLGYLRARLRPWDRRHPAIPLLQLLIEPARSIDFADPHAGFTGLTREPAQDRVLTLWADDLLSVRHGEVWMYVIDAEQPFPEDWLDLLTVPRRRSLRPVHAVVTAAYDGPAPDGAFRVADLDAEVYTSLARVEDRRGELLGRTASPGRTSSTW